MAKIAAEFMRPVKLGFKVLRLVFESSPKWSVLLLTADITNNILPSINLYLGKLSIDLILAAMLSPTATNFQKIVFVFVATLGLNLLGNFLGAVSRHAEDVLKDLFGKYAMEKVAAHAADLDLAYFEDPEYHDKLEKVQREIYGRPFDTLDNVINIVAFTVGLFSLLFVMTRLGWWVPLVILLISAPRLVFRMKYTYHTYAITDRRSPLNRTVAQLIEILIHRRAAKETKALGLKDYILKKFGAIYNQFIAENEALSTKTSFYIFLMDAFSSFTNFGLTLFAVYQVVDRFLTIGDLTMITGAISRFQSTIRDLFNTLARFYENTLFLQHYFEFIELPPHITNCPHPCDLPDGQALKIEFRHVYFSYDADHPILKDINFTIADARNFALVGENGAGKTTLVKLLLRLYDATAGEILINNKDIRDYDLANLRAHMGIVFQDFMTYDLPVRENIGLGDVNHINNIGQIRKAARLSGAADFIEDFPEKYKTMLGRSYLHGEELSGGQWQKIALARAFFKDAPILILDEPTSALDPRSEYEVFKNLIAHTVHKSLILISHRFSTVRLADEIIVLHKGEIVEQGSHEALMKRDGRYAKLYNLQAKWYK